MNRNVLITLLLSNAAVCASTTQFLHDRLESTARYKIWRTALDGTSLQSPSTNNFIITTHIYNYGACQTNSLCKGDKQTGCLNISETQREIDHKCHNQIAQNIQETLTFIPATLRGLIIEYVAAHMVLRTQRNVSKKPIVYIHPVDNNKSIVLTGEADDKELSAFSWNMLSNTIEARVSQPSNMIQIPEEIAQSVMTSLIMDYDQSKKYLIATGSQIGTFIWPKGSILERALAAGKATQILNNERIEVDNETFDTSYNTVRFSSRGRYVAVGSVDGTVLFIEVASGDCIYSIKHDTSVTALAKGTDGHSWLVGLENGDVYEWRGYLLEPPEIAPRENQLNSQIEERSTSAIDDGPEYELMRDRAPTSPQNQQNLQDLTADTICMIDCVDCIRSLSCRSGFKSSCSQCCRTSSSCLVSCPRCCICCCCKRCIVGLLCRRYYYSCAIRCLNIAERCLNRCNL
jgi:hypothetical protein